MSVKVDVRVRLQLIRHFKTCTTDIYLHNECAHVGLSIHAPVLVPGRGEGGVPLPQGTLWDGLNGDEVTALIIGQRGSDNRECTSSTLRLPLLLPLL